MLAVEARRRGASTGRRLRGSLAQMLGRSILAGVYGPGDTLPGEVDSAQKLNVSRGAYREAIKTLAAKGLVESRPRLGTVVLPRRRWNLLDADVLAWAIADEPEPRIAASIMELCSVVEPAAAAMAARHRSVQDLRVLRQALREMRRHPARSSPRSNAVRSFRVGLLEATHNPALWAMADAVGFAVDHRAVVEHRLLGLPIDDVPTYVGLVAALTTFDEVSAEEEMRRLLLRS